MKKLNKKQKILLLIIGVSVVVITAIIFWLQSGNSGQITQSNQQQKQAVATGTKQLDTQYVTLDYPAQYQARKLDQAGDDLEIHDLSASTTYTKKVSVSISNLPGNSLTNNSAYLLRKSYTDKYRQREINPTQLTAEVWVSRDNTEQTVFITQNGRVAVLAFVQAGGDAAQLTQEIDKVIASFRWK